MNIVYNIFIIIIIYIIYRIFNYESFTNNIYLSKLELEKTLINNRDKYYDTFNKNDLRVRNINNTKDYIYKIKNSCINISAKDKKLINNTIQIANNKLRKFKINGFDGIKASKIQWIIGLIDGTDYEYGLPHTRNYIIIIPKKILNNSKILLRVLIHEKIHIYQKIYPNDLKIWLSERGFIKFRLKENNDNIRANPDIDNYIYKDLDNEQYKSIYNELPLTINDVKYYPKNNYLYEHPFEYMAYTLEDLINK
jgi:hypothetical protein